MDNGKIRMKAKDSFYSDDTKQVAARSEFEVGSEARAKELEERGLAERVAAPAAKAEAAPLNDASRRAPTNKAEAKPKNKSRAKPTAKAPISARSVPGKPRRR